MPETYQRDDQLISTTFLNRADIPCHPGARAEVNKKIELIDSIPELEQELRF